MTDYFVGGDSVLENKFGITDKNKLKSVEQEIVTKKTSDLLKVTGVSVFDFKYLKYVHKTLFGDIYDFAGLIRTVEMVKPDGNVPFAYAKFIESEANRIFDSLKRKDYLVSLNRKLFTSEITNLAVELNALHPFREGNGRAIRLFLILLADHAGYLIDYSQVSSSELIGADKSAFEGDSKLLLAVYEKAITEI